MSRDVAQLLEGLLSGSPGEWIAFIVLVLAIATSVWAIGRYRASLRGDADPAAADVELMQRLRELRDSGDVTDVEYRSLKSRIAPPARGTPHGQTSPHPRTEAASPGQTPTRDERQQPTPVSSDDEREAK